MDKLDKEALKSDYKGMDELDKEALDPKWFCDEKNRSDRNKKT